MRVLYLMMVLALFAPSPSGLQLEVAGDGAAGVTVRASFVGDDVRLVLTATAADGRTVGPIQLNPAAEGRGFYSSGPVLSPGRWTVVVTGPSARATAEVQARLPQRPPSPRAAPVVSGDRPRSSHLWLWGLAALIAAAGFTAWALLKREGRDRTQ